jgi:hypothetical protein
MQIVLQGKYARLMIGAPGRARLTAGTPSRMLPLDALDAGRAPQPP